VALWSLKRVYFRKSIASFDRSKASPAFPSDKIPLRCRSVCSIGEMILTGRTEVLEEKIVTVTLLIKNVSSLKFI